MNASALKTTLKNNRHLLLAFALPMAIMYAAYLGHGIWPFGDGSVLVLDLNGQYVYYYEALKHALFGDGSVLYSWSRNLSGEMLGIIGYYLASPFSIVTVLFPRGMVTEGLLLMTLLKLGAAGLTFGIFLERSRKAPKFAVILFSILYALMGYAIVEVMNIMWIDGLIFLPLIILGTERLVKDNRFGLYVISLALMFVANFYIGYMIGIFTFLYFLYACFQAGTFGSMKLFLKRFGMFLLGAVIAVACAAFMLLPVYYSLKLGKMEFSHPDFTLKPNFNAFDFLVKLLPESYDTVRTEGLPFIYCGALTLFLLPLYFVNKQIEIKRKLGAAAILAVVFGCMYLSTVDIALHGFQVPNWLPYRYSFVFSFLLLIFAYEAFSKLEHVEMGAVLKLYAVLLGLLIVIDKLQYKFIATTGAIWFTVGTLTAYLALLYGWKKLKGDKGIAIILTVIVCTEMFVNIGDTMKAINKDVVYSSRSSYTNFIDEWQPVVDKVYAQDKSFFRMEKTTHRTVNDPMALNMYGISHSSSTLNAKVISLLKHFGFVSRGHYVKYAGGTPISDSLLGIKYVLTKDALKLGGYTDKFREGEIAVMENPNAMPIAFPVNGALKTVDFTSNNPFQNQNNLLSSMLGSTGQEYFKPLTVTDKVLYNLTEQSSGDHTRYVPTVAGTEAAIEYTVTTQGQHDLYMYLPTVYERKLTVSVNGMYISDYYDPGDYSILKLGNYPDGQTLTIKLTLGAEDLYMQDQWFYYFDEAQYQDAMTQLKSAPSTVTMNDSTHLTAKVTAKEDGMLYTSIPYEPGWTVKVDGAGVTPVMVCDGLMAVNITAGEHTITMSFFPKGLLPGIIISILGIGVLVLLLLLRNKKSVPIVNRYATVPHEVAPPELPHEDAEEDKGE